MSNRNPSQQELKCFSNWLDIPPEECPPNHYRLLGLPPFTQDVEQIRSAAEERLLQIGRWVRFDNPSDAADAKMLRQYINKVAVGLLDPQSKRDYDGFLQQELSPARGNAQPRENPSPTPVEPLRESPRPIAPPHATAIAEPVAATPPRGEPSTRMVSLSLPVWAWIAIAVTVNTLILGGVILLVLNRVTPTQTVMVNPPEGEVSNPPGEVITKPNNPVSSPAPPKKPVPPKNPPVPPVVTPPQDSKQGEKTKLPPSPPPERKPADPFAKLATIVDLGSPPQNQPHEPYTVPLGTLPADAVDDLEMRIHRGAARLSDQYEFELRRLEISGEKTHGWDVHVVPSSIGSRSVPEKFAGPLAHIFIDAARQLRFHWRTEIPFEFAAQLANAVLVLRLDNYSHSTVLRVPAHASKGALDLQYNITGQYRIDLPIDPLPDPELVKLELPDLEEISAPIDCTSPDRRIGFGDGGYLMLGETRLVTLQFQLNEADKPGETPYVVFRPFYHMYEEGEYSRPGQKPKGKQKRLTLKTLDNEITGYKTAAREKMNDYIAAVRELPGVIFEVRRLQALLKATTDQKKGAIIQAQLDRAFKYQVKLEGIIRNARRRLPNIYRMLGELSQARRLAIALHNLGPFEFRVLAETPDGEIELVLADGRPAQDVRPLPQPPPGDVAGNWLRAAEVWQYSINKGGGLSIQDLANSKVIQSGSWTMNGGKVLLNTATGGAETYQPIEDVELKGASGSLYRIF